MKCRYDPKYVLEYKSKHTKHVKFSKKVSFPLDTQKDYLNREWPHKSLGMVVQMKVTFSRQIWVKLEVSQIHETSF